MKPKKIITPLMVMLFCSIAIGQTKSMKYYSVDNKEIKPSSFKKTSKNEISFNSLSEDEEAASVQFIVSKIVVPFVFNNISKLFYKPENYIKEHSAKKSLINEKNIVNDLNKKNNIVYTKTIKNLKGSEEKSLILEFNIEDVYTEKEDLIDNFRLIKLSSYQLNYTNAKITNSSSKINIIGEIIIKYVDEFCEYKTYKTDPFTIAGIQPNGEKKSLEKTGATYPLPKMKYATSIEIKITEVNSKKKHMDKWLETYTKNKGTLQTFTIDHILYLSDD